MRRRNAMPRRRDAPPDQSIGLAQRVVVLAVVQFRGEPGDGGQAVGVGGIANIQHGREPVEQGGWTLNGRRRAVVRQHSDVARQCPAPERAWPQTGEAQQHALLPDRQQRHIGACIGDELVCD
ncbi:hypothetical protein ACU4HD_47330 [Cupriavidus basilensis]